MTGHRLEVADVFRSCGVNFLEQRGKSLSVAQQKAFRAIVACRTKALGGHTESCDHCEYVRHSYNSCRSRHCPKCQGTARAKWLEAREAELLPVPYFHVVFTLPSELGPLALQNQSTVYGILFRAAWETVRDLTGNPKHLGASVGMLAVLHSWGQNLMHHPHLHCIVPGGGISPDGERWIATKKSRSKKQKRFFLPVRVMSRVFRGKFIQHLKSAFKNGKLEFHGQLTNLANQRNFNSLLNRSVRQDWVVYCKRPFGGPTQVLKYLARYTHRVAISNSRLRSMENGKVAFQWKDYADGSRQKLMRLDTSEFIRRFLMHVLPSRFVRIRHFGFLSNRNRNANIQKCRRLLGVTQKTEQAAESTKDSRNASGNESNNVCPKCKAGQLRCRELHRINICQTNPLLWLRCLIIALWDTS